MNSKPSQVISLRDGVPAIITGTRRQVAHKLHVGVTTGAILSAGPMQEDDHGVYCRVIVRPAPRRSVVRDVVRHPAAAVLAGLVCASLAFWWVISSIGWWLLGGAVVGVLLSIWRARQAVNVTVTTTTTVTMR